MDSPDGIFLLGKIISVAVIYAAYASRRDSAAEAPPRRRGAMTDAPTFARTVGGWRTSRRRRAGDAPQPTPFPRSDPMYDRELDSWPYPNG